MQQKFKGIIQFGTGEKNDLNAPKKEVRQNINCGIMKSIGFFAALIFMVLLSCSDHKREMDLLFDGHQLSEELCFEIVSSNECQTYFNLRYEFLANVENSIRNGNSVSVLTDLSMAAIRNQKLEPFYNVIFDDFCEGASYVERLTYATKALYKRFPVLKNIIPESTEGLSKESIESFYMNIYRNELIKSSLGNSEVSDEPVCGSYWQQVKLLACATGCSFATAGIGTALCGWACWCMLCTENSSVADAICDTESDAE